MSDWRDEALILQARPHGETAAIADLFCRERGRCSGIVRGGMSRRQLPHLQPGSRVSVALRARSEAGLTSCRLEPLGSRAGLYSDPLALAALSALCAMLRLSLPELQPQPGLWEASQKALDDLGGFSAPGETYLAWEMRLLQDSGYGLDLGRCAVTGKAEDLIYISPKTGRAVSAAGAGDWADRLLPLPEGMAGQRGLSPAGLVAALQVTGFFLLRALGDLTGAKALPEARERLIAILNRRL